MRACVRPCTVGGVCTVCEPVCVRVRTDGAVSGGTMGGVLALLTPRVGHW